MNWLESFYENQRGSKCTCCSDCDNERDAAEKEIARLQHMVDAASDPDRWDEFLELSGSKGDR